MIRLNKPLALALSPLLRRGERTPRTTDAPCAPEPGRGVMGREHLHGSDVNRRHEPSTARGLLPLLPRREERGGERRDDSSGWPLSPTLSPLVPRGERGNRRADLSNAVASVLRLAAARSVWSAVGFSAALGWGFMGRQICCTRSRRLPSKEKGRRNGGFSLSPGGTSGERAGERGCSLPNFRRAK